MKKNKGWTWLCHHGILLEWCTDYKGRVEFIKENKPPNEVKTRLNAFRFVKGELPEKLIEAHAACVKVHAARCKAIAVCDKTFATYVKAHAACDKAHATRVKANAAYDKARAACDKANAAYDKARAARDKANAAYDKAFAACYPEILALFRKECPDVPWDDGKKTLVFKD